MHPYSRKISSCLVFTIVVFSNVTSYGNFFFADARSGIHIPSVTDVSSSSHWMDTNVFGHNRVVFDTSPGPERSRLKIFNVSESDDGLYRCRVDFKASQTRTIRLNLTVVGKF